MFRRRLGHWRCGKFDGECLFAIRMVGKLGRFIWRDFATARILKRWIDVDAYLEHWRAAQTGLEAAIARQPRHQER
jgi:hypothetical protein